jgi:hypothetical protein
MLSAECQDDEPDLSNYRQRVIAAGGNLSQLAFSLVDEGFGSLCQRGVGSTADHATPRAEIQAGGAIRQRNQRGIPHLVTGLHDHTPYLGCFSHLRQAEVFRGKFQDSPAKLKVNLSGFRVGFTHRLKLAS